MNNAIIINILEVPALNLFAFQRTLEKTNSVFVSYNVIIASVRHDM